MIKLIYTLKNTLNNYYFLIAVVLFSFLYLGKQSNKYFGWSNSKNTLPENLLTIQNDGSGYYAYLPQLFIYQNESHFSFLDKISKKYKTSSFNGGIGYNAVKKRNINKYYIGTAICISPFFLLNHSFKKIFTKNSDGYSKSYQFMVSFSALFYWLLGIIGLIKLLKLFHAENFAIALTILIITFGTNLNFYTIYFPAYSHIYSFCAIIWFIYFSKLWAQNGNKKHLLILSFILGLIFIIRPTNSLIVLIIPFLFENWSTFSKEIIHNLKNNMFILSISFSILTTLIFTQVLTNHWQIDKWTINTYTTESFNYLTNPKWIEVLFSYRKGFFMYAPIMLLLIPSIFSLFKNGKYFAFGWIFTVISITYLTSSWWCWWYGGGLGMRPFVDFMGLFSIPICLFINNNKNSIQITIIAFSISMISYYQILQKQYNLNIIHYDLMSKNDYWRIFLKSDKRFSWMLHFKVIEIKKENIDASSGYYFNDSKNKWTEHLLFSKEIKLGYDDNDPSFTFKPHKNWDNNTIGIRMSGKMMLSDPKSNPAFDIYYYKKGEIIRQTPQYIGYDISEINQLTSFSRDNIEEMKYDKVDSIKISLSKGVPITTIQNLHIRFFALKK